ncbi:MAG: DUF3301 domain-containing protein [Magnetococcales bacterium]|nr:DUF3301 domain-containing protein [Magnetococcales bacterium]
METLLLLVILTLVAWWYFGMQARERAHGLAKGACSTMDVTLLDDTVAIASLTLARSAEGRLVVRRIYTFDCVDDLEIRHRGTIILLGKRLENLLIQDLDPTLPQ